MRKSKTNEQEKKWESVEGRKGGRNWGESQKKNEEKQLEKKNIEKEKKKKKKGKERRRRKK